jgi:hypothetical protein
MVVNCNIPAHHALFIDTLLIMEYPKYPEAADQVASPAITRSSNHCFLMLILVYYVAGQVRQRLETHSIFNNSGTNCLKWHTIIQVPPEHVLI